MPVTVVVGAQWGDEGKGKITDLLALEADLVLRFGGGGNAGHTVVNEYGEFKLHSVPCGIFNPDAISLMGTGTVVDFEFLSQEIDGLEAAGVSTRGLRISDRAQVVMPYHLVLDRLEDEARGSAAIGTTRRGVGPAYVDKADRSSIRVGDLLFPQVLRQKLDSAVREKNAILQDQFGHDGFDAQALLLQCLGWADRFQPLIVDHLEIVQDALDRNLRVLAEGQLGALRDLDWGTYPYVTSSTTIAGGAAVGGGIPPIRINRVVGVVKAYSTAVGAGPFPTELLDETGDRLREAGREYGATTGRPRRVGWFDAVAVRYAALLGGFTEVAVTKLDVLDRMGPLKICDAYRFGDRRFKTVPGLPILDSVLPEYREIPGWDESSDGADGWDDLPETSRHYLEHIATAINVPISMVSTGPERARTFSCSARP